MQRRHKIYFMSLFSELEHQTTLWTCLQTQKFTPLLDSLKSICERLRILRSVGNEKTLENGDNVLGVLNKFDGLQDKLVKMHLKRLEITMGALRSAIESFDNIRNEIYKITSGAFKYYEEEKEAFNSVPSCPIKTRDSRKKTKKNKSNTKETLLLSDKLRTLNEEKDSYLSEELQKISFYLLSLRTIENMFGKEFWSKKTVVGSFRYDLDEEQLDAFSDRLAMELYVDYEKLKEIYENVKVEGE